MNDSTRREAETRLQVKERMAARRAEMIAAWRRRHNDSTCSDAMALIFAELEAAYGPPTPSGPPKPHCTTCECFKR